MNLDFTIFPDRRALTAYPQHATLEEFAELVRATVKPRKDDLPLVKFAKFGSIATALGCLRHDDNVIKITGVEGDYDGERVPFEDAVAIAEKAGLHCLLYSSPSYSPGKPRWRVVAPFSAAIASGGREQLMGRLNGIYGGILGAESWTLSQSYYFGRISGSAEPLVTIVNGDPLDMLNGTEFCGKPAPGNGNGNSKYRPGVFDEDALIEAIIRGDNFHVASVSLLGRWAYGGVPMMEAQQRLKQAFECVFPVDRDARWSKRYADIPRTVLGIYGKEAKKQDERVEFAINGNGAGTAAHSEATDSAAGGGGEEEPALDDTAAPVAPVEDWPEPLEQAAYHGLAGELVLAIGPHTEADPAAILFQFLVAAGNVLGRRAYFVVEDTRHHPNLFVALVGNTSKARKGTSWRRVQRVFDTVNWSKECVASGLSTGEGLIYRVRDRVIEVQSDKKTGKTHDVLVDPGVDDKRLLVIEEEFARPLRAMQRQENTLSAVLRSGWDGSDLHILTRKSAAKATAPHISIIAHVTRDDLISEMDMTSTANGFGNRFLFCRIRRSKSLPFGGRGGDQVIAPICVRIMEAINRCPSGELRFDHDAEELWRGKYEELSGERLGMWGAITARGEAQVIRLALLYALLDQLQFIGAPHLEAALAVWRYADASARSLFGDKIGDRIADAILGALRMAGGEGMSRTQIRDMFGGNMAASRIDAALIKLATHKLARCTQQSTSGRPVTVWRV